MNNTLRLAMTLALALLLTACSGGRVNKVETPSGMNMQRGRNYREVIEDFQDKGFTNIRTEPIEDLLYSWGFKNGEVEEITVGGDSNYDAGVWVAADTEVVIRYHTFNNSLPEDREEAENEALPAGSGTEEAGPAAGEGASAGPAAGEDASAGPAAGKAASAGPAAGEGASAGPAAAESEPAAAGAGAAEGGHAPAGNTTAETGAEE